ncbi:MAG TPA: glycosyltransferase family 9 protein, partial [Bacteroidia bacterium]|nr:glycosyltransferase family 9 protein [Bacteroidia bacterium]
MRSFLVIQTAFTGDVILATALIEQLKNSLPDATIDVLVRKGNETLLENNPSIRNVLIWDKRKDKFKNLFRMLGRIRNEKYTDVVNLQRFASSGILTAFSGAKSKSGFDKNPFSVFFTHKIAHE